MSTDQDDTRLELQRVATHILARARFVKDGRFGLRVGATGIATPAFGSDGEVLRVAGNTLVRERRLGDKAVSQTIALTAGSLQDLAVFAGIDLDQPFKAGEDSPEVGDPGRPIRLDHTHLHGILSWFKLAAEVLDQILPGTVEPSIIQLWPEHFDVGFDALTASGRVNYGASPGDTSLGGEPYLYVGPWESARPGDATYWNAEFGAVLTRRDVAADPFALSTAFFERGRQLLG